MGAFILAAIVFVGVVLLSLLVLFADSMRPAPNGTSAGTVLWVGMVLVALIAASHWMPHIGW